MNPSDASPPPDPPSPAFNPQPVAQTLDLEHLSATIYEQLKARGAGLMRHERDGHTVTPTGLVHEAYARLAGTGQVGFNNRTHLLAAAALAMRRVLVEHARARGRQKRGAGDPARRADWETVLSAVSSRADPDALLDLEEALALLAAGEGERGERYVRLVEFKVFGAMTNPETGEVLGVSQGMVEKDWTYVKAKMRVILGRAP